MVGMGGYAGPAQADIEAVCDADAYLHLIPELQHACNQLLSSDLFRYHSERMNGIMMQQAEDVGAGEMPAMCRLTAVRRSRTRTRTSSMSSTISFFCTARAIHLCSARSANGGDCSHRWSMS